MTSPVSWLVFPIMVVATTFFTRRSSSPDTPAQPFGITSAVLSPPSIIVPNSNQILMLLYDIDIDDDQLVSDLVALARISPQTAPIMFKRLQDLLNDVGTVSYLASRLFEMRNIKLIDAALLALDIISGGRHVAAFLLGLVTCEIDRLLEHDGGDLDEDFGHYQELADILLGYCGEIGLDDIPESVTEHSPLFLTDGWLRFEDPGAVRKFILSPLTLLRVDSHLLRTLVRCGVRFTLQEVLQSKLTLDEFHVILPYVHDMQPGIQHHLESLLRDRRYDWIQKIFSHTRFRYEFMLQIDYSYLVSALQRAVDAARWEEALFLLQLPGQQYWQLTFEVIELSTRIPSNIQNSVDPIDWSATGGF